MKTIQALGVAEGFAKAKAFVLKDSELNIKKIYIEDVEKEKQRADNAIKIAIEEIEVLMQSSKEFLGESSEIFGAHMAFLEDDDYQNGLKDIIEYEKVCAEFACQENSSNFQAMFEAIEDEYMRARAADIKDVSTRVIKILMGIEDNELETIQSPCIVVANDLTPSDTAKIGNKPVLGFITCIGGKTSHSAIMARTLGIAAIAGIKERATEIKTGDYLLLNGGAGVVIVNPDPEAEAEFDKKKSEYEEQQSLLEIYKEKEGMTKDGHRIMVEGNIGTPKDAQKVLEKGGEGIGLFRSEFLFMDRNDLPSEEEQFEAYKQAAECMKGKPIIIRTLDIGGDKEVPALHLEKENNPFLGYRAIRICLDREELFMIQLRALLRAGIYGNIRIMFPMISSLKEIRDAKKIVKKAKEQLRSENIAFREDIKIGIMIEIPVAAICADILAKEVDFFSIGTNDLIQYSCAVDRINEKVSHLYNTLHPGVLRLIKMAADAGRKQGIEVGVCGEMAGVKGIAPILCGLGVTNLSMAASSILMAKADLYKYTKEECVNVANKLLNDVEEF